uniref:Fatty acid hydroxylase domain-containing protein n=1 Tax=Stomoxys calcitrans TaxID=35570 RepID=A0A1I8QEY9_STOCA
MFSLSSAIIMNAGQILGQLAAKYHYVGTRIEGKWNDFLDVIGDDPQTVWVFGTTAVFMLVYWLNASWYTFMDITNRPKFVRKYKIQPGKNEPVEMKKLFEGILNVLMNQTIVGIPMYFVLYHTLFKVCCSEGPIRELPTLQKILFDIVVVSIMEEFNFYYIHRLMHHKAIYKYV